MNLEIKSDDVFHKHEILVPSQGSNRFRALKESLTRLDNSMYCRTKDQKVWHSAWTQACLPQIYNKNEKDYKPTLPLPSTNLLLQGSGRNGKRTALSMFLAAYLWTQKSSSIYILTHSLRESARLISDVVSVLPGCTASKGNTPKIIRQTISYLYIQAADGSEARLHIIRSSAYICPGFDIFILYKPELFPAFPKLHQMTMAVQYLPAYSTFLVISALRTHGRGADCSKLPETPCQIKRMFKNVSARGNSWDCATCSDIRHGAHWLNPGDICRSCMPWWLSPNDWNDSENPLHKISKCTNEKKL